MRARRVGKIARFVTRLAHSREDLTTLILFGHIDGIGQEFREILQLFCSPNFEIEQGHEGHVEILAVKVETLTNVLVLHSFSGQHLGANINGFFGQRALVALIPLCQFFSILFREENLVDDDIVGINPELGKFLDQSFGLVDGKKFRNAHTNLQARPIVRIGEDLKTNEFKAKRTCVSEIPIRSYRRPIAITLIQMQLTFDNSPGERIF